MMDMTRNFTLIVAPGQCVSYSYGYNTASKHLITIVSTNKEFINAHAEQFREYLGLCRSALKVHREPPEFPKMMMDFFALHGDVCQKTLPLPTRVGGNICGADHRLDVERGVPEGREGYPVIRAAYGELQPH